MRNTRQTKQTKKIIIKKMVSPKRLFAIQFITPISCLSHGGLSGEEPYEQQHNAMRQVGLRRGTDHISCCVSGIFFFLSFRNPRILCTRAIVEEYIPLFFLFSESSQRSCVFFHSEAKYHIEYSLELSVLSPHASRPLSVPFVPIPR